MGAHERRRDIAERRSRTLLLSIGGELRTARIEHGLSQLAVAADARSTQSRVSLIERGLLESVSLPELCRLFAAVGCEFAARPFPAGLPVRDVAHLKLLERLRSALPGVAWREEEALPRPGDLRAWDAVVGTFPVAVGVEAETRLADIQALERRVGVKLRDDPRVEHAVLLVADTRTNRRIVRAVREHLAGAFPLDTQAALSELGARGRLTANAIVLL